MTAITEPLFDLAPLVHSPRQHLTIDERFRAFHAANPWVADALERIVQDYTANGRTRISLKMAVEVIRWTYGRQTTGSEFKLDNTFTSRYVRLLIARHPEWSALFEVRHLRAA